METLKAAKERQNHGLTFSEALRNLSRYDIRTPFVLTICCFLCVMLSGPFAIIFYAVEIFQEAGTGLDQYLAAIITAILRIFGGLIALFLIQKLPRKKHMMLTMTTMGLSMITLGITIYYKESLGDSPVITVIPILCVSLYLFAFGAGKENELELEKHLFISFKGSGPLQWVFLAELLPPDYKVLSGENENVKSVSKFR